MCLKSYFKIKIAMALTLVVSFFSCGSYQYAGSDNDGIYSSGQEVVYAEEVEQSPQEDNSYYQNYFREKRMQYEAMNQESEIFTDVDSYSSDKEQDSLSNDYEGYGAWGSDNDEVIVNVYNNNWYSPYWGYYGGWYPYWGWGYYSHWHYPYYGYGWYNPYYSFYGYGYPYYYGYPYHYGGYYPYYGGYYYGRQRVAISGRRGSAQLAYSGRGNRFSNTRSNALTRDYSVIRDRTTRDRITTRQNTIRTRSTISTPRTRDNRSSTISSPPRTTRSNNSSTISTRPRTTRSNSSTISTPRTTRSNTSSGGRSISTPRSSGSSGGRSISGGGRRR